MRIAQQVVEHVVHRGFLVIGVIPTGPGLGDVAHFVAVESDKRLEFPVGEERPVGGRPQALTNDLVGIETQLAVGGPTSCAVRS